MSSSWISINPKLQNGISLINSLDIDKFIMLLEHIIQSTTDTIWTPEELHGLEESCKLSTSNVQLLVQSIMYIFKQSSKIILKPTMLQKQLVEDLKFNSDKAEEFTKIWTSKTKKDFENLESRKRLDKISWELNLQTASSFGPKEATPNVRMKFGLTNTNQSEEENIIFELNEGELTQLYNTLENIQNKLDFIQKPVE